MAASYRFYIDKPASWRGLFLVFGSAYVVISLVALRAPQYPWKEMGALLVLFIALASAMVAWGPGKRGTWIGLGPGPRVEVRPSVAARLFSEQKECEIGIGEGGELVLVKNMAYGSLLDYKVMARMAGGGELVLWEGGNIIPERRWLEFQQEAERQGIPLLTVEIVTDETGSSKRPWSISPARTPRASIVVAATIASLPAVGFVAGAAGWSALHIVLVGVLLGLSQLALVRIMAMRLKEEIEVVQMIVMAGQFALYFTIAALLGQAFFRN